MAYFVDGPLEVRLCLSNNDKIVKWIGPDASLKMKTSTRKNSVENKFEIQFRGDSRFYKLTYDLNTDRADFY